MLFTTSFAFCGELEYVIATAAPSSANRFAIAAPMPREAPETKATLPLSVFAMSNSFRNVGYKCSVAAENRPLGNGRRFGLPYLLGREQSSRAHHVAPCC